MTITDTHPHVVTEPGVYDLPEDVYHADPVPGGSLSVSGAKKLLPPYCPAVYAWERQHGSTTRPEFDMGAAAHRLVLGVGADLVEIEADNWRTKAANEQADDARARGAVPLLTRDMRTVEAMALALRAHPVASALLDTATGTPEASMFWQDGDTDVVCRGRLDMLPDPPPNGRLIVPDYKTAASADGGSFATAAARYGYHMQAAFYLDGVEALGIADDAAFLFVVQEKTAPYLVNVIELDADAIRAGRARCREALRIYRDCTDAGVWPGYSPDGDVVLVSLPRWAVN